VTDPPYIEGTAEVVPYEPQGLAVIPTVKATELVERLSVIREAMKTAMQPNVDYGHVPGTDKPALLKPGAEKLSVLFQLDVQLVNEKVWGPGDHLTVMSRATVFHAPSGQRLGYGEGLATTREKKHSTRSAQRVCPDCGLPAIIKGKAEYGGGWVCFKKKGGCGGKWPDGSDVIESQTVGEVENPDLPDLWNTVVKMAEKRARVDAVLAVTGASALFTQDIVEEPVTPVQAERWDHTDAPLARSKPSSDVSQPYVGDSDHEPPNVDRGGRIVDPELPQRPELVDAAKGLLLPAVQSCYTIAGLTPPERKRDAFRGLDDVQAETLESVLRNRRLQDAYPSDLGYTVDDLAPALKGDVDADADDLPWNEPSGSTSGDPVDRATVDPGVDPRERAPLLPLVAGDAPIDSVLSESDVALAERILAESFGGTVETGEAK
jgi:hypothetical protein